MCPYVPVCVHMSPYVSVCVRNVALRRQFSGHLQNICWICLIDVSVGALFPQCLYVRTNIRSKRTQHRGMC